jgi:hypothetical protein
MTAGDLPDRSQAVYTDADEIKTRLPEYHLIGEAGVSGAIKTRARFVHEESSDIHKELIAESLSAGKNVVADETGDSGYDDHRDARGTLRLGLASKVRQARDSGAGQVDCHFLSYPTDAAWERARERSMRTGREVPEAVVRETHSYAARNALRAMREELFDYIVLYDNDVPEGMPPRKVAERRRGEDEVIYDPEALKKIEAKAKERLGE